MWMFFFIYIVVPSACFLFYWKGNNDQLKRDAAASLKNDPLDYEWSIAVRRAQIDMQIAQSNKA